MLPPKKTVEEIAASGHFFAAGAIIVDVGHHTTNNFTLRVGSAEELPDMSTVYIKSGTSLTHIGHGVFSVAATKDLIETTAPDFNTHTFGRCGIATAEDTLHSIIASVDFYPRTSVGAGIISPMAATEDIFDSIGSVVAGVGGKIFAIRVMSCLKDIHVDIGQRRAVGVVTAIDIASSKIYFTVLCKLVGIAYIHLHGAIDRARVSIFESWLTKATTIEITIQRTA